MSRVSSVITKLVPGTCYAILALAVIGYLVVGAWAFFFPGFITCIILHNPAANIGIPGAALAAFVLVFVLWDVFERGQPRHSGKPQAGEPAQDQLEVKIVGSTFTGPTGPITLWVMCFLAFIVAIRLLMLDARATRSSDDLRAVCSDVVKHKLMSSGAGKATFSGVGIRKLLDTAPIPIALACASGGWDVKANRKL